MQKGKDKLIIAIDGFSSCGKSTVAKDLAKRLTYAYIDTGAMYRAVTLFALRQGLLSADGIDEENLQEQLHEIKISFKYDVEQKKNETFLNGQSVEQEIRGLEVSNNVSAISTLRFVRERMVELQQDMGREGGIVMDGRDIGTVVFPEADLKVFMTASPEIRAQRRYDELVGKGQEVSFEEILKNVVDRDHMDSTRKESPLRQADDAIVLDNSHLTPDEQLDWIVERLKEKTLI
ncbi:(d)CMP kinase [Marinilabiliaceae bacterium JC017]|nr:(d)CMP kinase [Marinilabiliaceae bacterium JC017]